MKFSRNCVKLFCVFLALQCATSKSHKSAIPLEKRDDSLGTLARLDAVKQHEELGFDQAEIITRQLDSSNADRIHVKHDYNLPRFQDDIDRAIVSDSSLLHFAEQHRLDEMKINLIEFKFRTIVESQKQLHYVFNSTSPANDTTTNPDTQSDSTEFHKNSFEHHGQFTYQQQISYMIPYVQANERYSQTKTDLLLEYLEFKENLNDTTLSQRWWLGLERMLTDIDIRKSESSYKVFQRSDKGLFLQPNVVMPRIQQLLTTESSWHAKQLAVDVFQHIQKRYSKIDDAFFDDVEYSKEMNRKLLESIRNEKSNDVSAREYFERGMATDDLQQRISLMTDAINTDSTYAVAYFNRGAAFQQANRPDDAIHDFTKTLEINPSIAPAHISLGNIYKAKGDYAQAIHHQSEAIRMEPNYMLAYQARGLCYHDMNDYTRALADFNIVLSMDSLYAAGYANRGDVYRAMNNHRQAIQDYSRALLLDSNYAQAYNHRGLSYYALKDYPHAIEDYQQAIELQPGLASAYYNIGVVYWELKEWDLVIDYWEKCLTIDPSHEKVLEYLPKARQEEMVAPVRKKRTKTIRVKRYKVKQ
ncbi:tetratricopeptide repeat protein [candidate division KSB1 bacterium]|nr:tetratricopeptide repeat protein [candidate division KSB1 bacterium]